MHIQRLKRSLAQRRQQRRAQQLSTAAMGPTRRQFLKTGVAATAGLLTLPAHQLAAQIPHLADFPGMPRPIPGGIHLAGLDTTIHLYLPTTHLNPAAESIEEGEGDPSTITDFEGTVGIFEYFGGTGTETVDGVETMRYTAVDVRFLEGRYIDMDGQERQGAFTFL